MTNFNLSIALGNDAMQTPSDVATLLRHIADTLAGASDELFSEPYNVSLRDWNGNNVGSYGVSNS